MTAGTLSLTPWCATCPRRRSVAHDRTQHSPTPSTHLSAVDEDNDRRLAGRHNGLHELVLDGRKVDRRAVEHLFLHRLVQAQEDDRDVRLSRARVRQPPGATCCRSGGRRTAFAALTAAGMPLALVPTRSQP